MMGMRTRFGAMLLALGALQLLVAEAVAARAWTAGPYSYFSDYLSDLAVPFCGTVAGREVCSPLHDVFTAALIAEGVLFAAAAVLLARGRIRAVLLPLAALHGLGMVVLALVPETAQGASPLHIAATATAILAADALVIVAGATARDAARSYRILSIVLGVIAFVSAPGIDGPATVAGLAERITVYAWIVWALVTSAALMVRERRQARATLGPL
jgi:hypothetical membrane protein